MARQVTAAIAWFRLVDFARWRRTAEMALFARERHTGRPRPMALPATTSRTRDRDNVIVSTPSPLSTGTPGGEGSRVRGLKLGENLRFDAGDSDPLTLTLSRSTGGEGIRHTHHFYFSAIAKSLFSVITYSTPLAATGVARIFVPMSISGEDVLLLAVLEDGQDAAVVAEVNFAVGVIGRAPVMCSVSCIQWTLPVSRRGNGRMPSRSAI